MSNLRNELLTLLNPAPEYRLARITAPLGADTWEAADLITGTRAPVAGTGVTPGDYVVCANARITTNLGPVDYSTATVG